MTKITSDAQALAVLRNGEWPIDQVCEAAAALDYLAARLASTSPAPDAAEGCALLSLREMVELRDATLRSEIHPSGDELGIVRRARAVLAAAPQPVVEKDNG